MKRFYLKGMSIEDDAFTFEEEKDSEALSDEGLAALDAIPVGGEWDSGVKDGDTPRIYIRLEDGPDEITTSQLQNAA